MIAFYIWAPYPNILGIGDRIAFLQQAWLFPLVLWLLHPPQHAGGPKFKASPETVFAARLQGRPTLVAVTGSAHKRKSEEPEKAEAPFCFKLLNDGRLWNFFTRRHRFHDSAQTNKEKVPLGIWPFYHWKPVPFLAIVLCRNKAVLWRDWRARIDSQVFCVTHFPDRQGIRGISENLFFSSRIWILWSNFLLLSNVRNEQRKVQWIWGSNIRAMVYFG